MNRAQGNLFVGWRDFPEAQVGSKCADHHREWTSGDINVTSRTYNTITIKFDKIGIDTDRTKFLSLKSRVEGGSLYVSYSFQSDAFIF